MEQTKENLLKAWRWLVLSSADRTKLSLSLKAGLPFVVFAGSLAGLNLNEGDLLEITLQAAETLTGLIALYGLGRKIFLTSKKA